MAATNRTTRASRAKRPDLKLVEAMPWDEVAGSLAKGEDELTNKQRAFVRKPRKAGDRFVQRAPDDPVLAGLVHLASSCPGARNCPQDGSVLCCRRRAKTTTQQARQATPSQGDTRAGTTRRRGLLLLRQAGAPSGPVRAIMVPPREADVPVRRAVERPTLRFSPWRGPLVVPRAPCRHRLRHGNGRRVGCHVGFAPCYAGARRPALYPIAKRGREARVNRWLGAGFSLPTARCYAGTAARDGCPATTAW